MWFHDTQSTVAVHVRPMKSRSTIFAVPNRNYALPSRSPLDILPSNNMSESKKEKKTKSEKKEKAEDQISSNRHDNTARQGTHKETTSATNSDSQKPEAGNVDADIASGKKDKKTKKHSADAAGEMKGTRGLRALVIGGTGEIGRVRNPNQTKSVFAKQKAW
jgi:hypothetical protein